MLADLKFQESKKDRSAGGGGSGRCDICIFMAAANFSVPSSSFFPRFFKHSPRLFCENTNNSSSSFHVIIPENVDSTFTLLYLHYLLLCHALRNNSFHSFDDVHPFFPIEKYQFLFFIICSLFLHFFLIYDIVTSWWRLAFGTRAHLGSSGLHLAILKNNLCRNVL